MLAYDGAFRNGLMTTIYTHPTVTLAQEDILSQQGHLYYCGGETSSSLPTGLLCQKSLTSNVIGSCNKQGI